jgi:hypothetical protein
MTPDLLSPIGPGIGGDSPASGLNKSCCDLGFGREHRLGSLAQAAAESRLARNQLGTGLPVDTPGQPGNNRSAVLSNHQSTPLPESADLFWADDRNVFPCEGAGDHRAGLPAGPGDSGLADQVRDLLVEPPSLEPPNITSTLVRPNKARACCSPNTTASCRHVCAA